MNLSRIIAIAKRQMTSIGACIYYSMHVEKNGINNSHRATPIVVTMTSFPARFKTIHLAIRSMLNQTVKPDKILLYLDDTVDDRQITKKMIQLKKCGLEIRKRPIDMKVHKKYYYAMKEFPDAIIVTVDDDMMYHKDLIERLIDAHDKYPSAVCAKRVHRITITERNKIGSYNDWENECTNISTPSMELCATGVGGVLYPPHLLDKTLFDVELLMNLSPKADDLWLKYIETISNVPVVRAAGEYNLSYVIQSVQELGLRKTNIGENQNDEFLNRMEDYFDIDWSQTIKENRYVKRSVV